MLAREGLVVSESDEVKITTLKQAAKQGKTRLGKGRQGDQRKAEQGKELILHSKKGQY